MLATHLLDTIPSIMREWRRELHSDLPAGLSTNQFRVLHFVRVGLTSQCYLARQLGVSPAAMSKMVEVLVKKSFLKREPNADDRRLTHLVLTKKGEILVKKVRSNVEARMQTILDGLDHKEQTQVDTALTMLQQVFNKAESYS